MAYTAITWAYGEVVSSTKMQQMADNDAYLKGVVEQAASSYVPTLSGVTLGSGGSVLGLYRTIAGWAHYQASVLFGSGGAVTGSIVIGLPSNSAYTASALAPLGTAWLRDSSASASRFWHVQRWSNVAVALADASGSTASAGTPWVWASGDSIVVNGSYPVA